MFSKRVLPLAILLAATIAITHSDARQTSAREGVLYTSVVDKSGEPVNGLGADDFIVREDNARREVLRVSRAVDPIAVAILIDNSTAAQDDIQNIRDALSKFVLKMSADNDVALIGIADRPTILQDYTRNAELLKSGIGRLFPQPGSGMMLLETIVEASRGLSKREEPRAVMIPIITDGTEFGTLHYNQVLESLKKGGAALHAVGIGSFSAAMSEERRNRAVVLDLGPRQSGGQWQVLLSSMALSNALDKLGRELSNQYKVVYGRPESLIPPEAVTVGVTRAGLTARGAPERRKPGA